GRDVYIVGAGDGAGLILKAQDGGKRMSGTGLPTLKDVVDVWGGGGSVYVVGGQSVLLQGQRPPAGQGWTRQPVAGAPALNRAWGSPPGDDFVVGDKGFIARTTDRGRNWQKLPSGVADNLNGGWRSVAGDVYVVGRGGTMLHSTGSGRTWTAQSIGTKDNLNAVWGSGPDDVYAVGSQGQALGGIFHSTDGGKTWLALMGGGRTFWAVWGTA